MNITITRKLEWDMGHSVTKHESKCKHLHGHRYVAELTCCAAGLDRLNRVIDFGVVKQIVGKWIDDNWDHKFMLWEHDPRVPGIQECDETKSLILVDRIPTAEIIADMLLMKANDLLRTHNVLVSNVRIYETPNGWADATAMRYDPAQQRIELK